MVGILSEYRRYGYSPQKTSSHKFRIELQKGNAHYRILLSQTRQRLSTRKFSRKRKEILRAVIEPLQAPDAPASETLRNQISIHKFQRPQLHAFEEVTLKTSSGRVESRDCRSLLGQSFSSSGGPITSEQTKSSIPQISQELWDMIVDHLPSLHGRHAAQALQFKLTERHQSHSEIWSKIFKDHIWTSIATRQGLNPVLLGDDLHSLYRDPMLPAYLVLLTADRTGNIQHDKVKLLASLRPHHWNENSDIVFEESSIILNISGALHNSFIINLYPRKLFSYQHGQLRAASLYWQDSRYELRTIGSDDVVGIGEQASSLQDISLICGITLTHPQETPLRQRHQQCFQHPDCPAVYPICPPGYQYFGNNILGWDWDQDLRN